MTEKERKDSETTADFNANAADPDSQREIRERVMRLVFGGDQRRFDEFLRVLSDATPDGVEVILRGSSVTGHKFGSDEPFDGEGPGQLEHSAFAGRITRAKRERA